MTAALPLTVYTFYSHFYDIIFLYISSALHKTLSIFLLVRIRFIAHIDMTSTLTLHFVMLSSILGCCLNISPVLCDKLITGPFISTLYISL